MSQAIAGWSNEGYSLVSGGRLLNAINPSCADLYRFNFAIPSLPPLLLSAFFGRRLFHSLPFFPLFCSLFSLLSPFYWAAPPINHCCDVRINKNRKEREKEGKSANGKMWAPEYQFQTPVGTDNHAPSPESSAPTEAAAEGTAEWARLAQQTYDTDVIASFLSTAAPLDQLDLCDRVHLELSPRTGKIG